MIKNWRRLLAPGISAFVVFWMLIALGVWQLHRLAWKEGIIAAIHRAEISAPIPLPEHPTPFQKVIITGSWIAGKAALYADEVHDAPAGPVAGGELLMPFREPSGRIILVDLGWVPGQKPRPLPEPAGPASVVGYLHDPIRPGLFAPSDNPADLIFYTLNPPRIGAAMGLAVAPFALIAMGPMPPPGSALPQPAQTLPRPPNNHYQYALSWFGFAGVLVFEFIFFARKRLNDP
jgi:surfeit locus 1 family protein